MPAAAVVAKPQRDPHSVGSGPKGRVQASGLEAADSACMEGGKSRSMS
jgi:hypothetical protein